MISTVSVWLLYDKFMRYGIIIEYEPFNIISVLITLSKDRDDDEFRNIYSI